MKRLLLLIVLAAFAPIAHAQEATPAKTELATIDPTARDLLARTAARYRKFESFESLIVWKIGEAGAGLEPRRFRVQMTRDGRFVVGEEFPDKSWKKWICDGETLVEFRSKHPQTYTRKSIKSPLYLGPLPQLRASLRSVSAEGPLLSLMLTDDFGSALLDPDLERVELQKEGALKAVVIRHQAFVGNGLPDAMNELKLWIEPLSMRLDRAEFRNEEGLVFAETYAQTRFNPQFAPQTFRAAAPLNYKLVNYFPDEATVVANPPADTAR